MAPQLGGRASALLGFAGLGILWEITAASGWFDRLLFPHLSSIFIAAMDDLVNPLFLTALLATFWKTLVAFSSSLLVAVPIGLAIGSSGKLMRALGPLIDFLRSVPATALFPAFLMFFGYGTTSKLALAIYPSVLLIIVGSSYGVRNANPLRLAVVRQLGASRARIFREVIFFEALPSILGSARIALSLVLVLVVVAELLVPAQAGLGTMIYEAQQLFDAASMYARIVLTGLLGYLFNMAFVVLERRIVPWRENLSSMP